MSILILSEFNMEVAENVTSGSQVLEICITALKQHENVLHVNLIGTLRNPDN